MNKKSCPNCRRVLPRTSFGIDRARTDGRNTYCRRCITEAQRIKRKACQMSRPSPKDLVLKAIKRGARTQDAIRRETHLDMCVICDALAGLWDQGLLDRAALRRREYRMAA